MIKCFEDIDLIKITDYANNLYKENERKVFFSLHEGIGGLLILNYCVGKLLNDSSYLSKADMIFDDIIDKITNGDVYDCKSFANGLPGLCWLLKYYSKRAYGTELSIGPEIDDLIKYHSVKSFEKGCGDPLYGGMGGLYYRILQNNEYTDDVKDMFHTFREHGKEDRRGYRTLNNILLENKDEEYDLGFAHGLAGYISILSLINTPDTPEIDDCISKSLKYIESQYSEKMISKFPASVYEANNCDVSQEERYNIRIGWCYGDLSMATMYMHLYNRTKDEGCYTKAVSLAKKTLTRKDEKQSHVKDIHFCHGSSYLYYIYHMFYEITHEECFKEQSAFWNDYTLQHFDMEKELNKNSLSFLNGVIGTLFTWFYIEKGVLDNELFQAYFIKI